MAGRQISRAFVWSHARLRHGKSIRLLILFAATIIIIAVPRTFRATPVHLALVAFAQQGRPVLVDPTERENSADRKRVRAPIERSKPRPPQRLSARVLVRSAPLGVTFTTDVPETEIFVNYGGAKTQRLGKTGADKKINTRMARGVYQITASRAGFAAKRQQINVRPGSTIFNFNLSASLAPTSASASAASSLAIEEVFRRFLDPKQTDSLTVGDWQRVQAQSSAAWTANPNNTQVRARALFAQGQLFYLRRDYASARQSFNDAALLLPASPLAYYGLGNAYLAANQSDQAVKAFQRVIELSPAAPLAYKGMADALTKQGKTKDARRSLDHARQLGYGSSKTNLTSAYELMKRKQWTEALRELQELGRTQATADVFTAIGDCYVGMVQPLSAAPAYQRATQLDPKSARAHLRYGEVLYESREYAAAVGALTRALELDQTGVNIDRVRVRKLLNQAAAKMHKMG